MHLRQAAACCGRTVAASASGLPYIRPAHAHAARRPFYFRPNGAAPFSSPATFFLGVQLNLLITVPHAHLCDYFFL